jgi:CBS domain-containing protein
LVTTNHSVRIRASALISINAVRHARVFPDGPQTRERQMSVDAASIMTRDVITVGPNASVAEVAGKLAEHDISAVPVCDPDGQLLGMLSEGDLMRPFGAANEMRRAWWLGVLAEGTDLAPEFLDYVRLDNRRARDLMTRDVITATERSSAGEVADMISKHRIKRVPILRDGKLVGIVSRADLVRALARSPGGLSNPA